MVGLVVAALPKEINVRPLRLLLRRLVSSRPAAPSLIALDVSASDTSAGGGGGGGGGATEGGSGAEIPTNPPSGAAIPPMIIYPFYVCLFQLQLIVS